MELKIENKKSLSKVDIKNVRASLIEDIDSLIHRKFSLDDAISFKLFFLQIFEKNFPAKENIEPLTTEEKNIVKNFAKNILDALISSGQIKITIPNDLSENILERINYLYLIFEDLKKEDSDQYRKILKSLVKIFNKNRAAEQLLAEKVRD